MSTCKHEWISQAEYNPLLDDDVEVERCSQCGTAKWQDDLEDYDWDDDEPQGVWV